MPFTKAIKFVYSKSLFNMLFLNELGPLGRWNKETCAIRLNKKIDLANEDNCGPCGEYILTQLDLTKTKTNKSASPYLMAEHEEQEHSKN